MSIAGALLTISTAVFGISKIVEIATIEYREKLITRKDYEGVSANTLFWWVTALDYVEIISKKTRVISRITGMILALIIILGVILFGTVSY